MARQKKNTLYPPAGCTVVLVVLAYHREIRPGGSEAARDRSFVSLWMTRAHDEEHGGTSGQVGSGLGLITQLLFPP